MSSREKKVTLKDYKPNFVDGAIEETMEELELSREEAIKLMTETSYRMTHGRKNKKKKKAV